MQGYVDKAAKPQNPQQQVSQPTCPVQLLPANRRTWGARGFCLLPPRQQFWLSGHPGCRAEATHHIQHGTTTDLPRKQQTPNLFQKLKPVVGRSSRNLLNDHAPCPLAPVNGGRADALAHTDAQSLTACGTACLVWFGFYILFTNHCNWRRQRPNEARGPHKV